MATAAVRYQRALACGPVTDPRDGVAALARPWQRLEVPAALRLTHALEDAAVRVQDQREAAALLGACQEEGLHAQLVIAILGERAALEPVHQAMQEGPQRLAGAGKAAGVGVAPGRRDARVQPLHFRCELVLRRAEAVRRTQDPAPGLEDAQGGELRAELRGGAEQHGVPGVEQHHGVPGRDGSVDQLLEGAVVQREFGAEAAPGATQADRAEAIAVHRRTPLQNHGLLPVLVASCKHVHRWAAGARTAGSGAGSSSGACGSSPGCARHAGCPR
mmetsp:Transcript_59894/g.165753  ORF Transcript_59894/g.165753 Transcript_59894/m.165753 type:complete len:274 (-) Transcript_59894:69-890(-)